MKRQRHSEEQIIAVLQEAQAGATIEKLCRRHGISQGTYYKWKQKFSGMEVNDARRLRLLEDENRKLKKLVADQALDMMVLKDCSEKNPKAQSTPHCHDRSHLPLWALFSPSLPPRRLEAFLLAIPAPGPRRHRLARASPSLGRPQTTLGRSYLTRCPQS